MHIGVDAVNGQLAVSQLVGNVLAVDAHRFQVAVHFRNDIETKRVKARHRKRGAVLHHRTVTEDIAPVVIRNGNFMGVGNNGL